MNRKIKMIFQQSGEDCGYAATAMLLNYYGRKLSLRQVKMAHGKFVSALSANIICKIASQFGVTLHLYFTKNIVEALSEQPRILHWNACHYVLAHKNKKGQIVIHDPEKGVSYIAESELSQKATGFMLEAASHHRKIELSESVNHHFLQIGLFKHINAMMPLFLIIIFPQILMFLSPLLLQKLINVISLDPDIKMTVWLSVIFMLTKITESGFDFWKTILISKYGRAFNLDSARTLMTKLDKLPVLWYVNRKIGELFNTICSVYKLNAIFVDNIAVAMVDGMISIVMVFLLACFAPFIFLIILCSIIVEALIYHYSIRNIKYFIDFGVKLRSECDQILLENIHSILSVRVNLLNKTRNMLWLDKFSQYGNNAFHISKFKNIYHLLRLFLVHLETFVIVVFSAVMIGQNKMSYGGFYIVLFYKNYIHESVKRMFDKYFDYEFVADHVNNINYIMHEKEDESIIDNLQFDPPEIYIQTDNICFRYPDSRIQILDRFSAIFQVGKSYCIVGASGSGKSTLLSLLMGIIQPSSGCFLIDGRQYSSLNHHAYKKVIASVIQHDSLFSGTILENISLFEQAPDINLVKEVCEISCIDRHIKALPLGYHTYIEGSGGDMSGGQIQRILLARALYKQPKILFLDEATSHLDPETERLINRNLAALKMTKIIAAHRLETIRICDEVVDLDHQRPAE